MPNAVVDTTGTTPQILAGGEPGRSIRVLGFGLTSTGSGVGILKGGSRELARIALPGGEVCTPSTGWGMIAQPGGHLTVEADTAGVRILGHVVYDLIASAPVPVVTDPNGAGSESGNPPAGVQAPNPGTFTIPASATGLI